ncbi:hypothetical protein GQX74_015426 [Glossina fuscipes]|nr:hypothetical protein GQX74_015426 [Glossina fuscipes]
MEDGQTLLFTSGEFLGEDNASKDVWKDAWPPAYIFKQIEITHGLKSTGQIITCKYPSESNYSSRLFVCVHGGKYRRDSNRLIKGALNSSSRSSSGEAANRISFLNYFNSKQWGRKTKNIKYICVVVLVNDF